jgi:hypothetical protein
MRIAGAARRGRARSMPDKWPRTIQTDLASWARDNDPAVQAPERGEAPMDRRQMGSVAVLTALLAGCVTVTTQTEPPASLPVPHLTTVPTRTCDPVAVTGVLHTDPGDPRVAWLETSDGARIEVVWPTGYAASWITLGRELFLEVHDPQGRLFMTTTDIPNPNHICDSGRPNTVLLMQTDS